MASDLKLGLQQNNRLFHKIYDPLDKLCVAIESSKIKQMSIDDSNKQLLVIEKLQLVIAKIEELLDNQVSNTSVHRV